MGEVYRARDPRLDRDVALKVLPHELLTDTDRLQRFEQEARAAAALNHPNILAVYDVGQAGGVPYIVSELLEGETLRAQLAVTRGTRNADDGSQRRLQPGKTVEYATQIARGLAAARDRGIVHRDLKPENIFVTTDGQIKILDFGLAKVVDPGSSPLASQAATGHLATNPGVVVGTIGYMAPEQVLGQPVDHRADIFALGVILYEMLSGRRAFARGSATDTVTAILNEHPHPLADLHPQVAPALARIVDRCLEKSPSARFQSIHDLRFALEGVATQSAASGAGLAAGARTPGRYWWRAAAALILLAGALAAVGWAYYRMPPESPRVVRFELVSPGDAALLPVANFFAVSPDGRHIAFAAARSGAAPQLWIRPLDSLEARLVPGTEGARQPFWSLDGRFIAFFATGTLKKVPLAGGPTQTICETSRIASGGSWSSRGEILYSSLIGPISRVPAAGGTPEPVTTPEPEEEHSFPEFLPGGDRFLFLVRSHDSERTGVYVKSLDADDARLVLRVSSNAAYAAPDHLVYAANGVLMAQPFDVDRAVPAGEPFPLAGRVDQFTESGLSSFSVSRSGVLVYRSDAAATMSRLVWYDRAGRMLGEVGEADRYLNPRVSPDGSRIAVERVDDSGNRDIWLMDVKRGLPVRFTFDAGRDASPVWSPDGSQLAWRGAANTYVQSSAGAGQPISLRDESWIPDDWLPDGSGLIAHPPQPRQIWLLPLAGRDRSPRLVVEGRGITTQGRISPDGKWVAFTSADSSRGRFDVYVQQFPVAQGRWQISTAGGLQPKWRKDGKELFYLGLDGTLMAVALRLDTLAEPAKPQPLFATRVTPTTGFVWHEYDVSPDGQRFLVNTAAHASNSPVVVVLNWTGLAER